MAAQQLASGLVGFRDQGGPDAGEVSGLAFASTAAWGKIAGYDQNGNERYIHLLIVQETPSGDSYKNAVKGSIAVDIVNGAIYRKTAAAGTDGWGAFN